MLKKLRQSNQGFTIIEVLIVLAIAGLILLIVFLAIPALQRNAHNTQSKNDATSLAGGVSEYRSNNAGANPGAIAGTGTITLTPGTQAEAKVSGSVTPANAAAATATNPLAYQIGKDCSGNPNPRAVAIYYWVETSGGGSSVCVVG